MTPVDPTASFGIEGLDSRMRLDLSKWSATSFASVLNRRSTRIIERVLREILRSGNWLQCEENVILGPSQ